MPVVTINPFVPSLYAADSFDPHGAFPTITLLQILGDENFGQFESERHRAIGFIKEHWPNFSRLAQYYLNNNTEMFTKVAVKDFGLEWEPTLAHQRTTVAYQTMLTITTAIVGTTGNESSTVISRFARKHIAAMKRHEDYLIELRRRGEKSAALERDLFTEISRFVRHHESWEMGLIVRFMGDIERQSFEELVLYRDEFSTLRDLYQQGFELACKCLWPLVAAQNTVKRGRPDSFGDDHPIGVPVNARPSTISQFEKLSNARKIAYVVRVPGWESIGDRLNSQRRNAIGHASAHHDLQTGRVVSDKDPKGMTYLEFLGETFGVFDALSTLSQVLRATRVSSSPDFKLSDSSESVAGPLITPARQQI